MCMMGHRLARVKLEWALVAMACVWPSSCAPTGAPEVVTRSSSAITDGVGRHGRCGRRRHRGCVGRDLVQRNPRRAPRRPHGGPLHAAPGPPGGHAWRSGRPSRPTAASVPIVRAVAHPQFDESSFANDVAVLVLATAGPCGAGPARSERADHGGHGAPGRVGDRPRGTPAMTGRRGRARRTVGAVAPATLRRRSHPLPAVRGGLGRARARNVRTASSRSSASRATATAPASQGATYTRVDAFLESFIQPTMAQFAEGSAASGAPCLFPEQCAGGVSACVRRGPDDPSIELLHRRLPGERRLPRGDGLCPGRRRGHESAAIPVPTPGAYGAACASDADCDEGQCTTTGVCALRCDPAVPACPGGFACTNTADVDFFCVRAPTVGKGGSCALAPPARGGALLWIAAAALALRVARRRARRR